MEINVIFQGKMAAITGTSFRHYRNIASFSDLMRTIRDEFPIIIHYDYRISVDNEITDSDPLLADGSEIAFILI
jgi:hypothetical protein